jgi:hypothetical protein
MSPQRFTAVLLALALPAAFGACQTLPKPKIRKYEWPSEAYLDTPKRAFEVVGQVKTKVNYPSLTDEWEDDDLCRNFFNKAVIDLVSRARDVRADAVIEVRSVTFFQDGKSETFPRAECVDDGAEGQVLAQGTVVRWKREADEPSGQAVPLRPKTPQAVPHSR